MLIMLSACAGLYTSMCKSKHKVCYTQKKLLRQLGGYLQTQTRQTDNVMCGSAKCFKMG